MTNLEERIMDRVRDSLGADRLERVIVYLDPNLKRAADRVSVGDVVINVPSDGYIVFVDLEPKANWGHACSYLVIRLDGHEVIEFAAHMPPFLKAEASTFRLLWRGSFAPEWAVVRSPK